MSKLGEARLGSTQFAEPADLEVSDEIDEAVRERAEAVMKSIYPTHDGTNWDRVLDIVLSEHKHEHEVLRDIIDGRFVDDASGEQLDMLAAMWQIERRSGESDEHFRPRIKAQFPRHTSRATIDEIMEISASLLDTSTERIFVDENFDIEPARFDIVIEEIVFHTAGVDVEDFEDLIQDVKPAGVRALATVGEQFTYRSENDFEDGVNNPEKAYGGYDDSHIDGWSQGDANSEPVSLDGSEPLLETGGPYADEITTQYT